MVASTQFLRVNGHPPEVMRRRNVRPSLAYNPDGEGTGDHEGDDETLGYSKSVPLGVGLIELVTPGVGKLVIPGVGLPDGDGVTDRELDGDGSTQKSVPLPRIVPVLQVKQRVLEQEELEAQFQLDGHENVQVLIEPE